MKTILVPTDFSAAASNAIEYAVEMAKQAGSKLILFHSFHIPMAASENPLVMPTFFQVEEECMDILHKIKYEILLKHGISLDIDCICKCGLAVDEINVFAEESKIDLIIIGMKGKGLLAEKLMGSTTTSLISKAKCPVLTIARNVKYNEIKDIVFACDFQKSPGKSVLDLLKNFAGFFKSRINVLNVDNVPEKMPVMEGEKYANIDPILNSKDHSFFKIQNEDIVNGINDFISRQKMGMVVMIPRKHSMLKNFFQESNTRRMAFHTEIPLLTLHE